MPRRRYYNSVTVVGEDGKKVTYTGEAADEIVQYIQDSELEPDENPAKEKKP